MGGKEIEWEKYGGDKHCVCAENDRKLWNAAINHILNGNSV